MSSNCISSRYRFIRLAHWWFRGIRFWNMQCVCAYYISVHAAFSFFCLALYLVSNDRFIFYERTWYPIRGKDYIGKNIRVHSRRISSSLKMFFRKNCGDCRVNATAWFYRTWTVDNVVNLGPHLNIQIQNSNGKVDYIRKNGPLCPRVPFNARTVNGIACKMVESFQSTKDIHARTVHSKNVHFDVFM